MSQISASDTFMHGDRAPTLGCKAPIATSSRACAARRSEGHSPGLRGQTRELSVRSCATAPDLSVSTVSTRAPAGCCCRSATAHPGARASRSFPTLGCRGSPGSQRPCPLRLPAWAPPPSPPPSLDRPPRSSVRRSVLLHAETRTCLPALESEKRAWRREQRTPTPPLSIGNMIPRFGWTLIP